MYVREPIPGNQLRELTLVDGISVVVIYSDAAYTASSLFATIASRAKGIFTLQTCTFRAAYSVA